VSLSAGSGVQDKNKPRQVHDLKRLITFNDSSCCFAKSFSG
jgi:hypothetical protein